MFLSIQRGFFLVWIQIFSEDTLSESDISDVSAGKIAKQSRFTVNTTVFENVGGSLCRKSNVKAISKYVMLYLVFEQGNSNIKNTVLIVF